MIEEKDFKEFHYKNKKTAKQKQNKLEEKYGYQASLFVIMNGLDERYIVIQPNNLGVKQ